MELKMFSFIEETLFLLDSKMAQLEEISEEIKDYFKDIIAPMNDGNLDTVKRIKSRGSLEEKIVRNNYYKKYNSSEELLLNLQDLIGIRIECRFIEDEKNIYKSIIKHFNIRHNDGFYYNDINKYIRLDIDSEQPQTQKNGFEIYKIDGVYEKDKTKVRFELQIKSLVNMFWSEIEHKIIYKNKSFMVADDFFKDIMSSIKKNLAMIDNQLYLVYDHCRKSNTIDPLVRKNQVEILLSKIIHDIFSTKMKNNIGFVIDFKKSCSIIVHYIFRSSNARNLDEYNELLLYTLSRLNDISKNPLNFNEEIEFERELYFDNKFCSIFANTINSIINIDFEWNLLFRILFEIETGNNAEDFEKFIQYMEYRFYNNKAFQLVNGKFSIEECKIIKNDIMLSIAEAFQKVSTVKFIYEDNIEVINEIVKDSLISICSNIDCFYEWKNEFKIYKDIIEKKILDHFE